VDGESTSPKRRGAAGLGSHTTQLTAGWQGVALAVQGSSAPDEPFQRRYFLDHYARQGPNKYRNSPDFAPYAVRNDRGLGGGWRDHGRAQAQPSVALTCRVISRSSRAVTTTARVAATRSPMSASAVAAALACSFSWTPRKSSPAAAADRTAG